MENAIGMNNNTIYHLKDPYGEDQATNKKYVDNELATKLDQAADIDMKNKKKLPWPLMPQMCSQPLMLVT